MEYLRTEPKLPRSNFYDYTLEPWNGLFRGRITLTSIVSHTLTISVIITKLLLLY